jgi:hypothetical protein
MLCGSTILKLEKHSPNVIIFVTCLCQNSSKYGDESMEQKILLE